MSERLNTEVLIVGTGISGLLAAIELSNKYSVTILSKSKLHECSTAWAQGGIAAVMNNNDHIKNHVKDTINNGHSICNVESVEKIIKQGKASINLLVQHGVNFNKNGSDFDQTLEGGHSQRRIVYHNDNTGEEIHSSLLRSVKKRSNILIKENLMAIDMIGKKDNYCEGLYAFDKIKKAVITIKANVVIIATGGASKIYQYTTNPNTSTGDGIAMAWRFGCQISNMEFIQFHPTCLYHPTEKSFLISESLRGEGAKLKDPQGNCFMKKYDDRLELAPRDVVARAINSALFLSHGIRSDTQIVVHLMGSGMPRRVFLDGWALKGVRPDERSISGHFKSLIRTPVPPIGRFEDVSTGIRQSGGGISQTLSEWRDEGIKGYVLDREGEEISDSSIEEKCGFVLSDDLVLDIDGRDMEGLVPISLGKAWLQGHSCITIVHYHIDSQIQ